MAGTADNYTLPYVAEPLNFHEDELTTSTLPGKLITIFTVADIAFIFVIFLTIAFIKDQKINYERQPIFLPFRPPRGFRMYAVLLETGQSPAGGTSAKVFLRIIGKLTKTPGFTLVCTSKQRNYGSRRLFGSQNKDIFILSVPHYLGSIESFEVMTDRRGDSPPWFLKSICVVSLNNNKCWKSEVSAWLRGDKKPYSIKANLIGALSTREYFFKAFLHYHLWTTAWFRSLGSSLQSFHRSLLLWISIGSSIWVTHFFLYDARLLLNIQNNKVNRPLYKANDIAQATCVSSVAGVLAATTLRFLMIALTGGTKWERHDDKDDLSHLMRPGSLKFALGAVIRRATHVITTKPKIEAHLDNLTEDQRRAIKHLAECKVSDCSLRKWLDNYPTCGLRKNNPYDQEEDEFFQASESVPAQVEEPIIPRYSVSMHQNKPQDENSLSSEKDYTYESSTTETSDSCPMRCDWDCSAGNPEALYVIMSELNLCNSKEKHASDNPSESLQKNNKVPEKETKRKPGLLERIFTKKSAALNIDMNQSHLGGRGKQLEHEKSAVPKISARSEESQLSFYSFDSLPQGKDLRNKAEKLVVDIEEDHNNSLSEPESDQELVTKSARTDSEINLIRRPAHIYDAAPQWHDKFHVWTENPNGGLNHHLKVNERYDFSSATVTNGSMNKLESSIVHYLAEEERISPGRAVLPNVVFASILIVLCALGAGAASGFAVYQRYFVSDADTVIFLYAMLFSIFLNLCIISTLAALIIALFATCTRRRKILRQRERNANEYRYPY